MIIDFKPYHFTAARLAPDVRQAAAPKIANLDLLAKHFLAGTSVVFKPEQNRTHILGLIGVIPSAKMLGCGEVFVLPTEERTKYPIEFARDIKGALHFAKRHFARIRARGEKDNPFYTRWFKFLGMKRTNLKEHGEVVWELA
ncbi:MAG: hypothetical protein KGJ13_02430 [Patescibacteria group bacterium]|nr:hypothetical protein [Patescibacteria group bacterium]